LPIEKSSPTFFERLDCISKSAVAPAGQGKERRDEAIPRDRHGALRASRDDQPWGPGDGFYLKRFIALGSDARSVPTFGQPSVA
jgi:hypothetical protein